MTDTVGAVTTRAVAGDDIMLSTTPNGSLSQLADRGPALTLELDEHDDASGPVWSVMVHGRLSAVPRGAAGRRTALDPVDSWPRDQFSEALRFSPHTISGRLLEHSLLPKEATP